MMKRYGNIYEKICDLNNLKIAHANAREDKAFYKDVQMVDENPDKYLGEIREMLLNHSYEVSKYKVSTINDKGKERQIMKLPYFPDRIIQWAIMLRIEPIFQKHFVSWSCASQPMKGLTKALNLTKRYLEDVEGTKYCLKMDVKKFYPSINHDILKELLRRKFKDAELLELLDKIIDSTDGDTGIPIGSYLSQYFGNYYLSEFDHWLKEKMGVKYVVRYMDDIIILSDSKKRLHELFEAIREYFSSRLKLSIKGNWQIFPVDARGIDFIGFRLFHDYTLLKKPTKKRMKVKYKEIKRKSDRGELITYNDFCSISSYNGWLSNGSCYHLKLLYVFPLLFARRLYHKTVLKGGKRTWLITEPYMEVKSKRLSVS